MERTSKIGAINLNVFVCLLLLGCGSKTNTVENSKLSSNCAPPQNARASVCNSILYTDLNENHTLVVFLAEVNGTTDQYPINIHDSTKVLISIEKFLQDNERQYKFCSDVMIENVSPTVSFPISAGEVYLSVCDLESSKVRISCYFKTAKFGNGVDSIVIKDKLLWADLNRADIGKRSG